MAGIMDKLKEGMSALGKAPQGKPNFPPKPGKGVAPAKEKKGGFPPKGKGSVEAPKEPNSDEEKMEKMQGLK